MGTLIDLLVLFGILAIVIIAVWFIMTQISLPEPIQKIVLIVAVVAAAVVACILLIQLAGKGGGRLLWLPTSEPNRAFAAVSAPASRHLDALAPAPWGRG